MLTRPQIRTCCKPAIGLNVPSKSKMDLAWTTTLLVGREVQDKRRAQDPGSAPGKAQFNFEMPMVGSFCLPSHKVPTTTTPSIY